MEAGGSLVVSFATLNSDLSLHVDLTDTLIAPGDSLTLLGTLLFAGAPVLGASVEGRIVRPDSSEFVVSLFDDGAHGDGAIDDGVYGGFVDSTSIPGIYTLRVEATGSHPSTGSFERVAPVLFMVGDQSAPTVLLIDPNGGEY